MNPGQGGAYEMVDGGMSLQSRTLSEAEAAALAAAKATRGAELGAVLAGAATDVIAALPFMTADDLNTLAALEASGKNRKSVLDAIAAGLAV